MRMQRQSLQRQSSKHSSQLVKLVNLTEVKTRPQRQRVVVVDSMHMFGKGGKLGKLERRKLGFG